MHLACREVRSGVHREHGDASPRTSTCAGNTEDADRASALGTACFVFYCRGVQSPAPASPISDWMLDPAVVHLNHGSYGGVLRPVYAAATAWRARLEGAPMRFFVLEWQQALDRARSALAAFLHADAARLAFIPSSTTGVAMALASASPRIAAGDELLTTTHVYRACGNQLARVADARGAKIVKVPIEIPFDPDAFSEAFLSAVTARTRVVLLDHITSPTALRLPVERLVPRLTARGIEVIVDGAHAPGQIDLDVSALGATWYIGNNHKWLCAPKASGFIVAAPDAALSPLVTSHGASTEYGPVNRLHAELDWSGTYDPSAHLAVPDAIAALTAFGDWRARNHALALALRDRFLDAMGGGRAFAPASAIGAMVAVPIELPGVTPFALQTRLLRDGWEVPIIDAPGTPLVRISAHLYNHVGEADLLARKLRDLGVRVV